jgi:carbonic anhydrase
LCRREVCRKPSRQEDAVVARLANSSSALLVVVAALSPRLAVAQHAEAEHAWSYEGASGPAKWGDLKSEYTVCRTGKHQSPIDIRNAKAADLPAIEFSYAPSPYRIVDNGHTVQVNVDPGSFITVGGRRYDLVQLHFHHPSEELINGQAYPMVAHLVHKDADGKLAVVALLLKTGQANPFIEALWKNMPSDVGQEHAPEGALIDLNRFLPASHGYYTFSGSLTTPPCSQDVTWFVLKRQVAISKAEVATFAAKYPHNARPVQPLNGRAVRATR